MQKSKCGDFRNPNPKRVATLFLSQSMATTQWNSAMLWQPRMKGGFGNNEGLDAGPSVHLLFIHFLHVGYQYIAINGFCWICFTSLNVGYRRAHPSLLTCSHSAPSGCLPYPEKSHFNLCLQLSASSNFYLWCEPSPRLVGPSVVFVARRHFDIVVELDYLRKCLILKNSLWWTW